MSGNDAFTWMARKSPSSEQEATDNDAADVPPRASKTKPVGTKAKARVKKKRPARKTKKARSAASPAAAGESKAPPPKRAATPKRAAAPKRKARSRKRKPNADELRAQIANLEAQIADLKDDNGAAPEPTAGPESTRALLASRYFQRQWGSRAMRRRPEPHDGFGHDPTYEDKLRSLLDFAHNRYFRTEVHGVEHIPHEGRCLVVANHSGGPVPLDGLMLRTALRLEHPAARDMRWLSEDVVHHLPFVGTFMNRLGAVRACPQNAERLLHSDKAVAVFPEGAKGIGKLYRERYKLQRFGRGGFVRLCLRTGAPLVPCAIIGAEDTNPTLFKLEVAARSLGLPYLPITPTFPFLGPLGLVPAPTKWIVRFGDPVQFDAYGPEAADDRVLVGRLADRVRATIQSMLDSNVARRQSVFFG